MKTAIIVLNYNDSENTTKFVSSVLHYQVLDKIIIVDNLSTKEDEFDKLQKLSCDKVDVVVTDKNGGYAYGNNFGLRYLDKKYNDEFKYVIISNPDVYVSEENIIKTIKHMENDEKIALCSPRMSFVTGPARRAAWKKREYLIDIANSTRITEFLMFPLLKKGEYNKKDYTKNILDVDNIAGSFFIARHKYFKEVEYFDENTFLFYEEDILSEKIKEKEYKIQVLNDIDFIHYESKSIGKIMNLYRKMDILFDSRIYYHKKYNKVGKFKIFLLNFLRYVRKIELLIEIPILKIKNIKRGKI